MRITKVAVALSVINCAVAAFAAEYVWDGGAGDGKWSSAANWNPDGVPGKDDDVVFNASSGSATVDEVFGGEVMNLTLQEGYSGTITLGRQLIVAKTLKQESGSFVCGDHDLHLGPKSRTVNQYLYPAKLELVGGTFTAPSGLLRVYSKDVGGAATITDCNFNANGGRFVVAQNTDINRPFTLLSIDNTFYDFEVEDMTPGTVRASNPRILVYGTNTVLHSFAHKWGNFWGTGVYNQITKGMYSAVFHVKGDVYTGGNGAGGGCVLLLDGDGDQYVHGDSTGRQCTTMFIDKPSGKVIFDGDVVAFGDCGANTFYGVKVLSQTEVDMTGLGEFYATTYSYRPFHMVPGSTLKAPPVFHVKNGSQASDVPIAVRDQTFNDLHLESVYGAFAFANHWTNTVTGTLKLGSGFYLSNGKSAEFDNNSGVQGALICLGDVETDGGKGGYLPLIFVGAGEQKYVSKNDGVVNGLLYVRKDEGGHLRLVSESGEVTVGMGNPSGACISVEGGEFDLPEKELAFWNCQNLTFKEKDGGKINTGCATIRYSTGCVNNHIGPIAAPIDTLVVDSGNAWFAFDAAVTITNLFKFSGAYTTGNSTPNIAGDFRIEKVFGNPGSAWNVGFRFCGDRVQTYSSAFPGTNTWGLITIDKTGGELKLESDMCMTNDVSGNTGYAQMDWKNGTINLNGHRLCAGNDLTMRAGARAVIPQGSLLSARLRLYVENGATFAFQPPSADDGTPLVRCGTVLSLPNNGTVNLELLGKVTPESVTHFPLFGYDSFGWQRGYDAASWNVTLCEDASRPRGVPFVQHVADDKTIYFNWKYRTGLCLLVR